MISFNQISANILTPGHRLEIDSSQSRQGLVKPRHRTLIIGQKTATGSAANNALVRVNSAQEAAVYFGHGSQLARMVKAYKAGEQNREVWCLPLNDAVGSTAATATITVTQAATEAGTLELMLVGEALKIGITPADSVASAAAKIVAAINAKTDLPFTATNALGVVTLTAKNKGTRGNKFHIEHSWNMGMTLPMGFGIEIGSFANGATDPDITTAYTAIGDEGFRTHVSPFTDTGNLAVANTAIEAARHPMVANDCYLVTATIATLTQNQAIGAALNFGAHTNLGLHGVPNTAEELAASYAAQLAASEDDDPGLPMQTLILVGMVSPKEALRHSAIERNLLLQSGIATAKVDTNGKLCIDRAVTTYKTNALGFSDTAFQDINAILLLDYFSYSWRARMATKYPRYKLGNDGGKYGPGAKVVTPSTGLGEAIAIFKLWEKAGLVENFAQFKADLRCERDDTDRNQLNILLPPDLINQLIKMATKLQFRS